MTSSFPEAPSPSEVSGEDRLIARFFAPLATHPGAMALGDDAAFFTPPPGRDLVLTKDAVVAGVHFFADDPPGAIAHKALRVNLSDLAAKGADPAGFLLALALPAHVGEAWLAAFARALGDDAERYGCALFGGDTVRTSGPLAISVTAFGTVPAGRMVHRAGARAGERVCVTGTIGDAALGLRLLRNPALAEAWALDDAERRHLVDRYRVPRPRNALAQAVRAFASAAMDVSDGLVGDLAKLCRTSGASARIEVERVPLSPAAAKALAADRGLIEPILTGGDDYEILLTLGEDRLTRCAAAASEAGVPLAAIGRIVSGDAPPSVVDASGTTLAFGRVSFSHF